MNRYRRPAARRSSNSAFPIIAFLLIAGFGILFAGCTSKPVVKGPEDVPTDVTFTEDDVAKVQEATGELSSDMTGSGSEADFPLVDVAATESGSSVPDAADLTLMRSYAALRVTAGSSAGNVYKVTNDVLKVRSQPATAGTVIDTLTNGNMLTLLEFTNAAWAHVQLQNGQKGFVSARYIAKTTSEDKLPEAKKEFEGLYYVDYAFVNVRASADPKSEKLGEILQDVFVKPISLDSKWARISFQGKEGYISADYISPFVPNFSVRQDTYHLPILHYDASQPGMIDELIGHAQKLKQAGYKLVTLRDLYDLVLAQEKRDTRLDPKSVVIAVTDLSADNVRKVSDALFSNGVRATLFLQTSELGISGITEKNLLTLIANGFDLQSAGHTGDDLRSLTNAHVKLELQQSRKLLEEYTKKPVFAIAYPQGGVNDRVLDLTANAGYLFGLGSAPESSFSRDQFLRLPSYSVTSSMTADDVMSAVK